MKVKFGLWQHGKFGQHRAQVPATDTRTALRTAVKKTIKALHPFADDPSITAQTKGALATIGRHYKVQEGVKYDEEDGLSEEVINAIYPEAMPKFWEDVYVHYDFLSPWNVTITDEGQLVCRHMFAPGHRWNGKKWVEIRR